MNPLIARLKVLGSLDIAERRLPQDGQFTVEVNDTPLSFRIATLPCRYGEKVALRLLHSRAGAGSPVPGDVCGSTHAVPVGTQSPAGADIGYGPTGSGKTVTLYSALQSRNSSDVNICSAKTRRDSA